MLCQHGVNKTGRALNARAWFLWEKDGAGKIALNRNRMSVRTFIRSSADTEKKGRVIEYFQQRLGEQSSQF